MIQLTRFCLAVLFALAQYVAGEPGDREAMAAPDGVSPPVPPHPRTTSQECQALAQLDRAIPAQSNNIEQEGIARRQDPTSIGILGDSQMTPAAVDIPSLAPVYSELLASISNMDSSLDSQISEAIQEMTAGCCTDVPDLSGSQVTLYGPTAASAPRSLVSSIQNVAAMGIGIEGAFLFGMLGSGGLVV